MFQKSLLCCCCPPSFLVRTAKCRFLAQSHFEGAVLATSQHWFCTPSCRASPTKHLSPSSESDTPAGNTRSNSSRGRALNPRCVVNSRLRSLSGRAETALVKALWLVRACTYAHGLAATESTKPLRRRKHFMVLGIWAP